MLGVPSQVRITVSLLVKQILYNVTLYSYEDDNADVSKILVMGLLVGSLFPHCNERRIKSVFYRYLSNRNTRFAL